MGELTSNKLEIPKSVHALPAFQDFTSFFAFVLD